MSKITLKSNDDEVFVIDEAVVLASQTIKNMIEDAFVECRISLKNVNGEILGKVIEYCKKHAEAVNSTDELNAWDADFIQADLVTLLQLVMAANDLNIKSLLDLTSQAAADMVKDTTPETTPEFICQMFNGANDFSSEEEGVVCLEN